MNPLIWSFLGVFVQRGMTTVYSIIIANLVLPETLGYFFSVVLMLSYGTTLFLFGIGGATLQKLNKLVVEDKNLRNQYFTSGLVISIFLSIISVLVFYIASRQIFDFFLLDKYLSIIYFMFPLILLGNLSTYLSRILQSSLLMKELTKVNTFSLLLQILFVLACLYFSKNYLFILLAGKYVREVSAFLGLSIYSFSNFSITFSSELKNQVYELFIFGFKAHIATIAIFMDQNIDAVLVNIFMTKEDLAIYSYAIKISFLSMVIGNTVSNVTFPQLTNVLHNDSLSNAEKIYVNYLYFTTFFVFTFTLIIALNSKIIIDLIFPDSYIGMRQSLIILLLGLALYSSFSSVGTILTAYGYPGVSTILTSLSLAVNIVLNIYLIPLYGILGAAVATSISFFIRTVILIYFVERLLKFNSKHNLLIFHYFFLVIIVLLHTYTFDNVIIAFSVVSGYVFFLYKFLLNDAQRNLLEMNNIKKFINKEKLIP